MRPKAGGVGCSALWPRNAMDMVVLAGSVDELERCTMGTELEAPDDTDAEARPSRQVGDGSPLDA